MTSLDNGGRFYNLFTKAQDGVITQAELGKVGGLFNSKQTMILFLQLSISHLDQQSKDTILSKLDGDLRSTYQKYRPLEILPSEAQTEGTISSNAILTGVPKLTTSKTDFFGFILVPVMAGKVTVFSLIPIIDTYDVYELRDEQTSDTFIIAHAKSSDKLPEKKTKVAGVIKELKANKEEKNASKKFLEAVYHVELDI